jgi:hypothetical protein
MKRAFIKTLLFLEKPVLIVKELVKLMPSVLAKEGGNAINITKGTV